MTQLSQVSIDWSSQSRSIPRLTTAIDAPIRASSSRRGPAASKISLSATRYAAGSRFHSLSP